MGGKKRIGSLQVVGGNWMVQGSWVGDSLPVSLFLFSSVFCSALLPLWMHQLPWMGLGVSLSVTRSLSFSCFLTCFSFFSLSLSLMHNDYQLFSLSLMIPALWVILHIGLSITCRVSPWSLPPISLRGIGRLSWSLPLSFHFYFPKFLSLLKSANLPAI